MEKNSERVFDDIVENNIKRVNVQTETDKAFICFKEYGLVFLVENHMRINGNPISLNASQIKELKRLEKSFKNNRSKEDWVLGCMPYEDVLNKRLKQVFGINIFDDETKLEFVFNDENK